MNHRPNRYATTLALLLLCVGGSAAAGGFSAHALKASENAARSVGHLAEGTAKLVVGVIGVALKVPGTVMVDAGSPMVAFAGTLPVDDEVYSVGPAPGDVMLTQRKAPSQ
ncbi:MAG: hypothetical protein K0U93_03645 [Gammaproteobacteria bacterium]|nr:hypothetical protein [Gammaproteobacteria bacterium]